MIVWLKTDIAPADSPYDCMNEFGSAKVMERSYPDGHLVWIAAKGGNVVLDPLQCETLVTIAEIGVSLLLQLLASQETKAC